MNGYTPWELATLKTKYHRSDGQHKGFLTLDDLQRLCTAASSSTTSSIAQARSGAIDARRVFNEVDVNHDGQVTFDELVAYLGTADTPEATTLKHYFLVNDASMATGASFGLLLLLKTKGVIALGAFFADPIRLFRDYYVEYTSSIRAHHAQPTTAAQPHQPQPGVLQSWRRLGLASGSFWFLFAVCLDSGVGVAMFLTYSFARARISAEYRQRFAPPTLVVPCVAADGDVAPPAKPRVVARPFTGTEHFLFEWSAGCCAGAVSGVLEIPAQTAAHSRLRAADFGTMLRKFGHRPSHRIARGAASHGAFFSAFHGSRAGLDAFLFRRLHCKRTTFRSALITAASGCCAGAAYRVFAVPMENWSSFVRHEGKQAWRVLSVADRRRIMFRGLGASMALTMPVTGIIFLGYEYALMTW